MRQAQQIKELCWPAAKVGQCVTELVRRSGLSQAEVEVVRGSDAEAESSLEWQAKRLGCEAEIIEATFADLEKKLSQLHPALVRLGDEGFLAILDGNRRTLRILTAERGIKRVALREVCQAVRNAEDQPSLADYARLVSETKLSPEKRSEVVDLLLAEQLGGRRFDRCWMLRGSPGAQPGPWLRQVGAWQKAAGLMAAHLAQYLLLLAAWVVLGRRSFAGSFQRDGVMVWAILLLTAIPFRVLSTWLQGQLVVGVGTILKRRLLFGALRLEPDEVKHQGVGSFLGQALEAEAVETLLLSGGLTGLLAVIELAVSGFLLGRFAWLLCSWIGLTAILAWRFWRRHERWTESRMQVTEGLIESMVGHRTRLAQQRREDWHEAEDVALNAYFEDSRRMDGSANSLVALIPRGWLLVGLACLAPMLAKGASPEAQTGILIGGLLLAYNSFTRLTAAFAEMAAAAVAWQRIAPLFGAAARSEEMEAAPGQPADCEFPANVIEADALSYSYRGGGKAVLKSASLVVRRGERVLLEGLSGGGKSTLAGLLAGLREPESGALRLNGVDRQSVGRDRWRKQVVAAPQFHENHILTETFAFNVLMGRGWPPSSLDMIEAERICRELGLGELLDRMPAGMMQMVGEGGWQLSHGERSRVYVARAILQNPELMILDESFGALDPENLKGALECTLRHAQTLMVIAHP